MKMLLFHVIASVFTIVNSTKNKVFHCRDPDLGGQAPTHKFSQRKFLLLTGAGAGLGNFLIFYPAAYFFAALTGRDILIKDDSLLAEMCSVIHCGFPLYSEMAAAFPSVLDQDKLNRVRGGLLLSAFTILAQFYCHSPGVKAYDMQRHISGEHVQNDQLLRADGYKYMSGWYLGSNHSKDCITQLTGCADDDVSCHDRHALQRLVRGPFKSQFSLFEESRVIGVPSNLKHGLMTLPHSFAPRLDASIHLRCQFKHFEYLVGPDDTMWPEYVKEVDEWLYSTDFNKGMGLFKVIEAKIMEELHLIKEEKAAQSARRLLIGQYNEHIKTHYNKNRRKLGEAFNISVVNVTQLDYIAEHAVFKGDKDDKIYVYLASDNERVKDALASYLLGHTHISVMRVKHSASDGHIVHAKNVDYLRQNSNNTGTLNLVLDWYAMSLSNVVFAWRRDTGLLSTFAQSAQRMSGNTEEIDTKIHLENDSEESSKDEDKDVIQHSKGFQLVFQNNHAIWRDF